MISIVLLLLVLHLPNGTVVTSTYQFKTLEECKESADAFMEEDPRHRSVMCAVIPILGNDS